MRFGLCNFDGLRYYDFHDPAMSRMFSIQSGQGPFSGGNKLWDRGAKSRDSKLMCSCHFRDNVSLAVLRRELCAKHSAGAILADTGPKIGSVASATWSDHELTVKASGIMLPTGSILHVEVDLRVAGVAAAGKQSSHPGSAVRFCKSRCRLISGPPAAVAESCSQRLLRLESVIEHDHGNQALE